MSNPVSQKGNVLLAKYLAALQHSPLLTKATTAAILGFLQEEIASKVSGSPSAPFKRTGIPPVDLVKAKERSFAQGTYGFLISAPLSHFLNTLLQKAFLGQTSIKARLLQILSQNIFIAPIQQSTYLFCMAFINGSTEIGQAIAFVKLGFWRIMKLTWIISPISMVIAQKFLPPHLWALWFNLVSFAAGTFMNIQAKKRKLGAEKARREAEERGEGVKKD